MKKTIKVTAATILSAAAMNFMNITTHTEVQALTNWTRRSQDQINAQVAEVLADGSLKYVIQPGDTLSGIAKALEIPTTLLAELNNIEDPDLIIAGTILIFNPETQTITIENSGEEPIEIQAETVAPTEVAVVEEVSEWVTTPETEEATSSNVEQPIDASIETVQPVDEWIQPSETNEVIEESHEQIGEPNSVEDIENTQAAIVEETPNEELVEETLTVESLFEEEPVVEESIEETVAEEETIEEESAIEELVEEPIMEETIDEPLVYEEPVYEVAVEEESAVMETAEEASTDEELVYEEPVYEEVVEEVIVEEPVYEEPAVPAETTVDASIPAHLQELASYPENAGLSVGELEAKYEIRRRESTHNYDVYSVSGNHYGAYQMLDSYFHQYGDGTRSASSQEAASNGYVMNRYGSWQNALAAHNAQGWY